VTTRIKKAELHCHIEGAASPALVKEQAQKYGVDVSNFISGDAYVWSDFTEFLVAYDGAASLFRSEEDYALLARTYLEGIAAENAIYAEIFVSPDHAAAAGLSPTAYFDGLADGMAAAKASTGIECRMIIVGVRHLGAEKVEAAARLAGSRPHPLITGFGMAGEERFGRVADFARAFDIAGDAGLGITIHAGELAGPESVRDALDHVHPARIGHGVRAIEGRDTGAENRGFGRGARGVPRLQSRPQCISGYLQPSV
jgi:adenosine deaminase